MKKLMIAAAVAALAGMANAASYIWTNSYGLDAYGVGGDAKMASGTIYLMDAANISQTAFVAAVLGAKDDYATEFADQVASAVNYATLATSGALSNPNVGTVDNGGINVSDAAGTEVTYYQVLLDTANKGVYVSETVTFTPATTGAETLDFTNDAAYNGTLYGDTVTTFQAAGWYTAGTETPGPEPTPEPTSAMLMLLGMAGLALKRKRA